MTRAFDVRPAPDGLLEQLVELANRAPSAGKTQGWHVVALEGDDTAQFWDITLPPMRRGKFKWQRLLDAPVILLAVRRPQGLRRSLLRARQGGTGLGVGPEAWPAPYWTIDTSMAVMTLLLAAEDAGLGALFFGVFKGERELRQSLGVPAGLELLGAIALGYPAERRRQPRATARAPARPGRARRQIIRRGGWSSRAGIGRSGR